MIPPPNAMKIVTFSELTANIPAHDPSGRAAPAPLGAVAQKRRDLAPRSCTPARLGGARGGAPLVDQAVTGDLVTRGGDALLGQRDVARIGLGTQEVASVLHRRHRGRT